MDSEYMIGYIVAGLVNGVIWGFVSKHINESKGYDGGFAWGFWLGVIGVIVVAVKPENTRRYSYGHSSGYDSALSSMARETEENRLLRDGGWKCNACRNVNPGYVTTCTCGLSLADHKKRIADRAAGKNPDAAASAADAIAKYKKLLDDGIITEADFNAKKKQLLGL